MPTARLTGRETPQPPTAPRPAADVQRRRREVALTATWLRELRGLAGSTGAAAGRFTRRSA